MSKEKYRTKTSMKKQTSLFNEKKSKMTFDKRCLIEHINEGKNIFGGKSGANYDSLPLFKKESSQMSLFEMVNETPK